MRRSIDDRPGSGDDLPPGWSADGATLVSWSVAVSDDYDDSEARVVLTLEEVGRPGTGLSAHLPPAVAARLRAALHDGLRELGADPGR